MDVNLIIICHACEHRQQQCAGPCPCTISGKDIIEHATEEICPLGLFDGIPRCPRTKGSYKCRLLIRFGTPIVDYVGRAIDMATLPILAADSFTPEGRRQFLEHPIRWPWWARGLRYFRKSSDFGVGDTFARLVNRVGGGAWKRCHESLGKSCWCNARQKRLNEAFPYVVAATKSGK